MLVVICNHILTQDGIFFATFCWHLYHDIWYKFGWKSINHILRKQYVKNERRYCIAELLVVISNHIWTCEHVNHDGLYMPHVHGVGYLSILILIWLKICLSTTHQEWKKMLCWNIACRHCNHIWTNMGHLLSFGCDWQRTADELRGLNFLLVVYYVPSPTLFHVMSFI